ncbi:hypothetical protein ACGFNX_31125 [Streptomyces sp. NPDC048723]|uniref:hypothetical protein n=1 Tax=Streptomyces sp. NPDC048723 TaxID=3365589 RepID=UPI0037228295
MFAIDHHVSPWIAWLLDPMVAVALGTVLIFDGRLSEYGLYPSGGVRAPLVRRARHLGDELLDLPRPGEHPYGVCPGEQAPGVAGHLR